MKTKKENWFKKHYKFSWIIGSILFMITVAGIFYLYNGYLELKYADIFDIYEDDWVMSHHGENTYKLKIIVSNITIGQSWVGESSKAIIEFYNEHLEKLSDYLVENVTWGQGKEGKFYGKLTKTVGFTEGNVSETRYIWLLFELDPKTNESFAFISDFIPQIWREEPRIKW